MIFFSDDVQMSDDVRMIFKNSVSDFQRMKHDQASSWYFSQIWNNHKR